MQRNCSFLSQVDPNDPEDVARHQRLMAASLNKRFVAFAAFAALSRFCCSVNMVSVARVEICIFLFLR
jgi:hypothetical protein